MEKDIYKEIIEEVSKKLADKICSEEKGLAARATMIDQDVKNLVQEIALALIKTDPELLTKTDPPDITPI
jgi:signal recognition particle GTPase